MIGQHTPGPWAIEEITPSDFHDCYILGAPNGVYDDIIATVQCTDLPQCMADARLIAAAPCLLAALEAGAECLVSWMEMADSDYVREPDEQVLAAMRAAIAKATGQ